MFNLHNKSFIGQKKKKTKVIPTPHLLVAGPSCSFWAQARLESDASNPE
jgi:hypothetical protein